MRHMDGGAEQQTEFGQGHQRPQRVQMLGVAVKGICAGVDKQVAGQVAGQKSTKRQTGDGHHQLFANRCPEGAHNPAHLFLRFSRTAWVFFGR